MYIDINIIFQNHIYKVSITKNLRFLDRALSLSIIEK